MVEAAKFTSLPIQESKVQWGNVLSSKGELYTHLLSSPAPGKSTGFLVSERLSSNVMMEVHSEKKLQRFELNILADLPTYQPSPGCGPGSQDLLSTHCHQARHPASGTHFAPHFEALTSGFLAYLEMFTTLPHAPMGVSLGSSAIRGRVGQQSFDTL